MRARKERITLTKEPRLNAEPLGLVLPPSLLGNYLVILICLKEPQESPSLRKNSVGTFKARFQKHPG